MMKKNGFVFIETIVAIVVLTTSLLLLYTSFSKLLQVERTRVYYDNISYVYKTWNIKKLLVELDINENIPNDSDYLILNDSVVNTQNRSLFNSMLSFYDVNKMIILKPKLINDLKKGISSTFFDSLPREMQNYIRSISLNNSIDNILVVEFNSNNEKKFYSWVGVIK